MGVSPTITTYLSNMVSPSKFFVKAPKGYKGVNNIMRTTAPDIDNLEKAVFDSIFKGLKIKDSRIVMVAKAKFQELHRPRTEITLKGIE